MKILLSTFGPDPENTLAAMRALPYGKLILVLSEGSLDTPGYRHVRDAELAAGGVIENLFVDEFDFRDCFRNIVDFVSTNYYTVSKERTVKNTISINISGGSKIMGDAALLAAFVTGVPAYHCEKARTIRFPVITDMTLRDRFTSSQRAVLREMGARDTVDDIARKLGPAMTDETIRKALRKLRKMGVIRTVVSEGKITVELTEPGIFVVETIGRFERNI